MPGEVAGVMRRGCVEARVEFMAGREAADDVICLENEHALPCAGEVGGANQAIMAGTNDDSVVTFQVSFRAFVAAPETLDGTGCIRIRAYTQERTGL